MRVFSLQVSLQQPIQHLRRPMGYGCGLFGTSRIVAVHGKHLKEGQVLFYDFSQHFPIRVFPFSLSISVMLDLLLNFFNVLHAQGTNKIRMPLRVGLVRTSTVGHRAMHVAFFRF